ncbi:Metal tolerance protein 9, partial [Mucuna pruriens]
MATDGERRGWSPKFSSKKTKRDQRSHHRHFYGERQETFMVYKASLEREYEFERRKELDKSRLLLQLMDYPLTSTGCLSEKEGEIFRYPGMSPAGSFSNKTLATYLLLLLGRSLFLWSTVKDLKMKLLEHMYKITFFDVITNFVGLAAAVLAIKFYWWIDPTGAIVVSS